MIEIQISHTVAVIAQFISTRRPTLSGPIHTVQVIRVIVAWGWQVNASDQLVIGSVWVHTLGTAMEPLVRG